MARLWFLIAGLGLIAPSVHAEGAAELQAKAEALRLAQDPEWLRLGHWVHGHSEARGLFFLASDGADNPVSELRATLQALFDPDPPALDPKVPPPGCRFPARAIWLAEKLQFSPPSRPCPLLADWFKRTAPRSISLIFSSYYLNNPASMFGHTFLRIHRQDAAVAEDQRELLDVGVDYSAEATTANPLFYAFKGMFGLFRGTFHSYPYYYKVREYNDFESRDLWEYELRLTPRQVFFVAAHLFELGSSWFPYYYSRENCSWLILSVIEAAVPDAALLARVKWPVIPADTVKALGPLLGAVHYRPSASTQLRARLAGMSLSEVRLAEEVAAQPSAPVEEGAVRVLDAAADLIDVRSAKELVFDPGGEAGTRKQAVLARRASLLVPSPPLLIEPLREARPDEGHGSGRLDFGGGGSTDGKGFGSIGFRLALHDLLDPPAGYPELAQIQFLPLQLRWSAQQSVRLERADFVDALSLHPVSIVDQALSWRVRAGSLRLRDAGCDCYAGSGEVGSGFTLGDERFSVFAMANFQLEGAPALRGLHALTWLRAGAGPFGGVRLRILDRLVYYGQAQWTYFPAAIARSSYSISSELRVPLGPVALGVLGRLQPDAREAMLRLFTYY